MTDFLLDTLKQLDSYKGLIDNIKKEISPLATYGIIDENLGHFIYGLNTHLKKQIILITDNEAKARHLYEDIKSLGKTNVDLLPSREIIFYDIDASSHDNRKQRLSVISKLINKEEGIIITTV
ncbi:MAG TPA: transcription-repair coupling factor, partial [Tissierellaceae bacterium]|nr:transcription-repair coupling factor [Tissierellaceae bacterium]